MSNSILNFKTAYLWAIAKSWKDEDYKKKFHEEGEVNILEFLENNSEYPEKFINPWKNLVINFLEDESHHICWDPIQTGGWVGANDRLTIYLPEDPGIDNRVEALAKYNFIFPTFMGRIKTDLEMMFDSSQIKKVLDLLNTDDVVEPAILNMGLADFDLLAFSAVLLRSVSLYWDDENFKEHILNKKGDYSDKTAVLSKWFGFNNPWNFSINFKRDKNFKLDEDCNYNYPANVVSLGKPMKPINPLDPDDTTRILPIALAAYNDDGGSYPFTCC